MGANGTLTFERGGRKKVDNREMRHPEKDSPRRKRGSIWSSSELQREQQGLRMGRGEEGQQNDGKETTGERAKN